MAKTRSLTVLLLRGPVTHTLDFLKPDLFDSPNTKIFELSVDPGSPWLLAVRPRDPQPPSWSDFFSDHVDEVELGSVSSSAAALIVPSMKQWYAITFGYGRYLLASEKIVNNFGLTITLNTVGEDQLRSIDKETFDVIAAHARQQASRETDALGFGLDVERDMLRAVAGIPYGENRIADRLYGKDALCLTGRFDLDGLSEVLCRLDGIYEDDSYQERFPWVDRVREVTDQGLINSLVDQVIAMVSDEDYETTWLATPEILEWADVRFFTYSEGWTSREYTDVHWRTFVRSLRGQPLSQEVLHSRKIFCFGDDGRILGRWPVVRCVYGQLDFQGDRYLVSGGRWYRIARDYVEEVDDYVNTIAVEDLNLPLYDDDSETLYNQRASSLSNRFTLMDSKLILHGGGQGKIEFCDLYGKNGEIVHIKRFSGSRDVSYLFQQGFVSGQLFRIDTRFQEKVSNRLREQGVNVTEFDPSRFRIIFALISRSEKPLRLPFFSKITLRYVASRLRGYGFEVSLAKIEMTRIRARLERSSTRKKRTKQKKRAAR